MTREDRLTEIDDYVAYLNQLAASILPTDHSQVQITVLGFSQGAATVSRWLSRAQFRPAHLILWAGAFPLDMDFTVATGLLRNLPVTIVCGDQDEYIKLEDLEKQAAFLRNLGVEPQVITFSGKHTLNGPVLQHLHGLGHSQA
jgi:predicted esterase